MSATLTPHGMYFEDFEPGQTLVTAGRTITESDVVNFAGLSGDYNQIHTDVQFSQHNPWVYITSLAPSLVRKEKEPEETSRLEQSTEIPNHGTITVRGNRHRNRIA